MTNPFSDIDSAFSPFFMDSLTASCKRNSVVYTASLSGCIFPIDDENPFDDQAARSNIKLMNFLIQKSDWNATILSSFTPEIGDSLSADGYSMRIDRVDNECGNWRLEGRTI